MTVEEIHEAVSLLQSRQTELDDIEVKSAQGGLPQHIWRTLSAFANRHGGGTVLFGLDPVTFRPIGLGNADQLQRDLASLANQMEPPVSVDFAWTTVEGMPVLAAAVREVDPASRPCYFKPVGLREGSYRRVGDQDQKMSDYQIHLLLAARTQPQDDRMPVDGSSLKDLDETAWRTHLARVRRTRPSLRALNLGDAELLRVLNVVGEDGRCTLAGLLFFGRYPQQFFPNLVITISSYPADDADDPHTRLSLSAVCDGSIPDMAAAAMDTLERLMTHRVVVESLEHEEFAEYPAVALRELLVNAVVHRDYSRYATGSQVQLLIGPRHLEVRNPGGIFGPLSIDDLGNWGIQSSRNAALAMMAFDAGLMENRGTGIHQVLAELRARDLEPPRWVDDGTHFTVRLSNRPLMDRETLSWLARFSALDLDDNARRGLAYLRRQSRIDTRDYQLVTGLGYGEAVDDLNDLCRKGILSRQDVRGGPFFILGQDPDQPLLAASPAESAVLACLRQADHPLGTRDIAARVGAPRAKVLEALGNLMKRGLVAPTNPHLHARSRKYAATRE